MPGKSYNEKGASGKCLSDEQLYGFLEKLLSRAESHAVQEHLDSCSACFDDMVTLARNAHTPTSEAEKLEITRLRQWTPAQQVDKILGYVEAECPPTSPALAEGVQEAHGDETVLRPKIDFWEKLGQFFESWKPLPRYAFALALVLVGMLGTLFTYQIVIKKDADKYYVYDDRVPYEYSMSSLRAPSTDLERDSLFQAFVTQFTLGMSDYMVRDYESAINTFQNLGPAVMALKTQPDNQKIIPWIRDFCFYLGVSHFALLRSRQHDFDKTARVQHANASIRWLALADSLVTAHHLEGSDREAYFLGLAYGFAGQNDAAITQLKKINRASDFYNDSVKLIQRWSKQ
ncbi:zf-HC2 domain-containing protein [candidate division KSB1 bacterium]|nr:zf-HC2 domain-containing protein [candidate division KSB1 bacterium]